MLILRNFEVLLLISYFFNTTGCSLRKGGRMQSDQSDQVTLGPTFRPTFTYQKHIKNSIEYIKIKQEKIFLFILHLFIIYIYIHMPILYNIYMCFYIIFILFIIYFLSFLFIIFIHLHIKNIKKV